MPKTTITTLASRFVSLATMSSDITPVERTARRFVCPDGREILVKHRFAGADVTRSTGIVRSLRLVYAGKGGRGRCVTSAWSIRAASMDRAINPGNACVMSTGEASYAIKVSYERFTSS